MSLHKNGRPLLFVQRMESGEKRTLSEWAEEFNVTYTNMGNLLVGLRKKGYNYHPHPGKILVKGIPRVGIVVDIMKKEDWLRMGINAYEDNNALPSLRGAFRIIEAGISKHPQIAVELQSYVDNIQVLMIESRKKIFNKKPLELGSEKPLKLIAKTK